MQNDSIKKKINKTLNNGKEQLIMLMISHLHHKILPDTASETDKYNVLKQFYIFI